MENICDICGAPKDNDLFQNEMLGDMTLDLCANCSRYCKMLLNRESPTTAKHGIIWAKMVLCFFVDSPPVKDALKKACADAYIFYIKKQQ